MFYYIEAIWGVGISAGLLAFWFTKRKRGTLPEDHLYIAPALAGLFIAMAMTQTLYAAKVIGRSGSATIMVLALLAFTVFGIWQRKTLRRPFH